MLKDSEIMDGKTISLVVPVLNEEDAIGPFIARVSEVASDLPYRIEFVFVNDGSFDSTLEVLRKYSVTENILVLNFSRNFGKEAALTAGIEHATGDAIIPIDVDLQDPPILIANMVKEWERGFDVVLARRIDRSTDGWLKRKTAEWFYQINNALSDTPIPDNVGDFRLMDRRVVEAIKTIGERRRFMKGIFAWVGYKSTILNYVREERAHGKTKFSGWRLWNFGLEGITSFSTAPLRIWTYLGTVVSAFAISYAVFILIRTLLYGKDLPGYASIMIAILFFAGVQLIGIGVLGEYVGRIYIESKKRPLYILEGVYRNGENTSLDSSSIRGGQS